MNEVSNKFWFRSYTYGYGWYPVKWQGWIVMAVYVLSVWFGINYIRGCTNNDVQALIYFLPQLICNTILLFIIVVKTEEKASWRWGSKKDS